MGKPRWKYTGRQTDRQTEIESQAGREIIQEGNKKVRKDDGKEIPTTKRAKAPQLYSSGRVIFISPITHDVPR